MSLIDQARSASPIPLILSYKTPISVLSVTSVVVNPLHCRKLRMNFQLTSLLARCKVPLKLGEGDDLGGAFHNAKRAIFVDGLVAAKLSLRSEDG